MEESMPLRGKLPRFYSEVRWAPCSLGRGCAFLMIPFVIALIGLTYIPYVRVFIKRDLIGYACLGVFHLLLGLMMTSYFQVVFTDPGTVPRQWHEAVEESQKLVYKRCKHTNLYKPLRAHYCNITRRVVLNLDHFCPWVANAVGFRNRKFFILFCFYSFVTSLFCAITLAPEILGNSSNNIEGDNTVNKALTLVAFIMDATFAVALALFCVAHFYMASKNQTSLEDAKQSKRYDLGWYENMQTVFGVDHWTWFIPHHISPTLGDGVHWKLSDGTWEGFADSATSTV